MSKLVINLDAECKVCGSPLKLVAGEGRRLDAADIYMIVAPCEKCAAPTSEREFISDIYGIMKDGDGLSPKELIEDVTEMLKRHLDSVPAPKQISSACAAGNHYTNDGRTREFDYCPDCGKQLMKDPGDNP